MSDPPNRIFRLNEVLDRTGLSRSTIYRRMQAGTFPKNIKISTRCAGWREWVVEAWMRKRYAIWRTIIYRNDGFALSAILFPQPPPESSHPFLLSTRRSASETYSSLQFPVVAHRQEHHDSNADCSLVADL